MEPKYVGIDLHRRRSVIVRMSPDGERLSTTEWLGCRACSGERGPQPAPYHHDDRRSAPALGDHLAVSIRTGRCSPANANYILGTDGPDQFYDLTSVRRSWCMRSR